MTVPSDSLPGLGSGRASTTTFVISGALFVSLHTAAGTQAMDLVAEGLITLAFLQDEDCLRRPNAGT